MEWKSYRQYFCWCNCVCSSGERALATAANELTVYALGFGSASDGTFHLVITPMPPLPPLLHVSHTFAWGQSQANPLALLPFRLPCVNTPLSSEMPLHFPCFISPFHLESYQTFGLLWSASTGTPQR